MHHTAAAVHDALEARSQDKEREDQRSEDIQGLDEPVSGLYRDAERTALDDDGADLTDRSDDGHDLTAGVAEGPGGDGDAGGVF